jgi:peptidoglycan hydrolase-like protein with peptidoglycan-binding domain
MTTTTTHPTLSEGATGPDVKWAQYLMVLKTLDYDEVDGIFGPETDRAVRNFQGYSGLDVDGIVGPLTWAALHAEKPRPPTLAAGSAGPVVHRVQEVLNLGRGDFSPDTYPVLVVDGEYGPLTARAVRGTQQMAGVLDDGTVGLQTWALSAHASSATLASLCGVTAPQP